MDVQEVQKPLKERYRLYPNSDRTTLQTRSNQSDTPVACSVDVGRMICKAQAHVRGEGLGKPASSGDPLLAALAARVESTCKMVAAAPAYPPIALLLIRKELDQRERETLGISKEAAVGFENIRVNFKVDAPEATGEQLSKPREKREDHSVVIQSMVHTPNCIPNGW